MLKNKRTNNALLAVIIETVNEVPEGAPEGPMYAAMMGHGVKLEDFQWVVSLLVDTKLVKKDGHLLTITDKGRQMADKIAEAKRRTA